MAIKLVLVALLFFLCFQIIAPFLLPAIWGAILAISLHSAFVRLSVLVRGFEKLSAALITVLALALLIGPVGLLGTKMVDNLQEVASHLQAGEFKIPFPPNTISEWPIIGETLYHYWSMAATDLEWAMTQITPQLKTAGGWLIKAAAGLGAGFLQFLFAIIIAGLLLPHAASCGKSAVAFAEKTTNQNGAYFVDLAGATVRNVAWGVMGVSLLQGLLSGMAFVAIGIPFAGLLAFLVFLMSAIQIGPAIVIIPVVVYVFSTADIISAGLFAAWIVPVMLLDNILKPILVSRGLDTPMIVIFMGVIGGTLSFGIIGLFVGPVALGIGYKLFVEWIRR